MSLLKDIDLEARLLPLRNVLESIKEFNLDTDDENVLELIREAYAATGITEASRSEFDASRGMMQGAGVQPERAGMGKTKDIYGKEKESRIGLLAASPQKGDPVVVLDPQAKQLKHIGDVKEVLNNKVWIPFKGQSFGGEDLDLDELKPLKQYKGKVVWRMVKKQK